MYIHQFYDTYQGIASYYIENEGVAAIVDPIRPIDIYLQFLEFRKASLSYILETHLHSDFISGHLDLSRQTKAPIIFGPDANCHYKIQPSYDGEILPLGKIFIKIINTPGHTLESACFLLMDEQKKPYALFSGDTLLQGRVGIPDTAQEDMILLSNQALLLQKSLQEKIMTLPDEVILYPLHSNSEDPETPPISSIGEEKTENEYLKISSKETFIQKVINQVKHHSKLNRKFALLNKTGYDSQDEIMKRALKELELSDFEKEIDKKDTTIIDTRNKNNFFDGFIPGSLYFGAEGSMEQWVATMIEQDKNILLICEEGQEQETITRLAQYGIGNIAGYLKGGFPTWVAADKPTDIMISVEVDEFAIDIPFDEKIIVLDVREPYEYEGGHVRIAENIPLGKFSDPATFVNIEDNMNLYLYCAAGYRSIIAASYLKRQGFHNLRNVAGGWKEIKNNEEIIKRDSLEYPDKQQA